VLVVDSVCQRPFGRQWRGNRTTRQPWDSDGVEADTLVIEFGESAWLDGLPALLLARRLAIPAVEWQDGLPGQPSSDQDDLELDLTDTVHIELELTFPRDTDGHADDFWTAAHSGQFSAADLADAEHLVTPLGPGRLFAAGSSW
jgi:hypothetical protein